MLLEAVDDPDPIQVGENTTYTIKATNQGFADIHNVKIVHTSDEETRAGEFGARDGEREDELCAGGGAEAKQVVTYMITVKGNKAATRATRWC
ncbi:MAG: hypothetical protein U1F83_00390 [Verrucomicrobiota bacterium]